MDCDTDSEIRFTKNENFTNNMLDNFVHFRKEGEMVDFCVKVDNKELHCHRVVIAACSPVLYRMIMTAMKEGQSNEVDLDGVQAHIMERILQYMYSGEMSIKQNQLVNMVQACDYLQVLDLKEQCLQRVPHILTPNNAISWYHLANLLSLDKIKKYIFSLFKDFVKHDEFLDLEYDELKPMLEDGGQNGVLIDDLLRAVMPWIDRDAENRIKAMEELLTVIEVEKSSWEALRTMFTMYKHLVEKNPLCYKILMHGLVQLNCAREQVAESRRQLQEEHQASQKDTVRLSYKDFDHYVHKENDRNVSADLLLCRILHWIDFDIDKRLRFMEVLLEDISLQNCTWTMLRLLTLKYKGLLEANNSLYKLFIDKLIQRKTSMSLLVCGSYHKKYKVWKLTHHKKPTEISKVPQDFVSAGHSICTYRDVDLILTGGISGRGKVCVVYNSLMKQWMKHMNMREDRFRHASVCLSEMLYVLGGDRAKQGWSVTVHCHAMDGVTWPDAPDLPIPLEFPKATSHSTNIYAMGDNCKSLLIYDTTYRRWMTKETPLNPGYGFSMAASNDQVFFAGGTKKLCYAYAVITGSWMKLDPPGKRHIGGVLVYHGNKLILLGGDGEGLDEYSIEEDTWEISQYTMVPDSVHVDHACALELV